MIVDIMDNKITLDKRELSISFIRCIAMLSVIFCHFFEYVSPSMGGHKILFLCLGNHLANGVQLFLLISGYLYSKKDFSSIQEDRIDFIFKNFIKILKDYWLYCIFIAFPIYTFLEPTQITLKNIVSVLLTSGTIWGIHHLWYISYILFCYLITPFLFDLKLYFKNRNTNILKSLIYIAITVEIIFSFFKFYFYPAYILCFVIGFYFEDIFQYLKIKGHLRLAFISVAIISILLGYYRLYTGYINPINFNNEFDKLVSTNLVQWSQVFFALFLFSLLKKLNLLG